MAIVKVGATALYSHLAKAGVRIFEYCERPLHGKVALVDDEWSTVGSSNLDPLSLQLNLEANVVIRDRTFNAHLAERLEWLVHNSCKEIQYEELEHAGGWLHVLRSFIAFHLVRLYPAVTSWLPRHRPKLAPAMPEDLSPACAVPGSKETP
jgi:cardiolipin synthase